MKVLVTGANGQLGSDFVRLLGDGFEVKGVGREEMDITSWEQTRDQIHRFRPDVVIHAAAYTEVDRAESDEAGAYRVNAAGSRNVALAAEQVGAKICYISTDYVFDGRATTSYREYDNTNPLNVYGKSKRAGEQLVQSLSSRYFIVRTSWVYGANGRNFVKTMLNLASQRNSLQVVEDQVGSPTYTVDLVAFVSALVQTESYGVYHATNSGTCSWYEFAKAIFEEAGLSVEVTPCTTENFPRPAVRPQFSVLEHLAIRVNGLEDLPDWRDALRRFLQETAR